jgi:nitrate/nitrite-specific signal transduction histidine kinase
LAIFTVAIHKVSITFNIWTADKYGLSYSCVTAHYIDHDWILQKRVLSFRTMNYPHTAQIIYQSIINVLHEYNLKRYLENKIFSIYFHNVSNNIKSIDYFTRALNPIMNDRMFHQKCACYILSLKMIFIIFILII